MPVFVCINISWHMYAGHRETCGIQFSSIMRMQGIKLRASKTESAHQPEAEQVINLRQ